jgi:hypothetical protein
LKKEEGPGPTQVFFNRNAEEVLGHSNIKMTEGNAEYLTGNLSSAMRVRRFRPVPFTTEPKVLQNGSAGNDKKVGRGERI